MFSLSTTRTIIDSQMLLELGVNETCIDDSTWISFANSFLLRNKHNT